MENAAIIIMENCHKNKWNNLELLANVSMIIFSEKVLEEEYQQRFVIMQKQIIKNRMVMINQKNVNKI